VAPQKNNKEQQKKVVLFFEQPFSCRKIQQTDLNEKIISF